MRTLSIKKMFLGVICCAMFLCSYGFNLKNSCGYYNYDPNRNNFILNYNDYSQATLPPKSADSNSRMTLPTFTAKHIASYTFYNGDQGWRDVGYYCGGGLAQNQRVPSFNDIPANWDPNTQRISLSFETSIPLCGLGFLHRDLNSPSLEGNNLWQGITKFTFDVTAENFVGIGDLNLYVRPYLHGRKPDGQEFYLKDKRVRRILFGQAGVGMSTYEVDVDEVGVPAGSTILNVNLRFIIGDISSGDDAEGLIEVDNVTPIGWGPLP